MDGLWEITFRKICVEELSREKTRDSIGLLAEKRLHGILKRWILDDPACAERRVADRQGRLSRYTADILTPDGHIFEIQTGSLYPLHRKMDFYMSETDYTVTLVHPLSARKTLCWLNPKSGDVISRRRSPKRETPLHALAECRPFLPYLFSRRFSLCLPLLEVEEYRLADGWGRNGKRGSHRYELMPVSLLDTQWFRSASDYIALFPSMTVSEFTAADVSSVTGLSGFALYDALAVFEGLNVIERCGKSGRATLYRKKQGAV